MKRLIFVITGYVIEASTQVNSANGHAHSVDVKSTQQQSVPSSSMNLPPEEHIYDNDIELTDIDVGTNTAYGVCGKSMLDQN